MAQQIFARLGDGLNAKDGKRRVADALDHHWVELCILILVICDVVFVMIEAGVDHHIICVGGRVMPTGQLSGEPRSTAVSSPPRFSMRFSQSQNMLVADAAGPAEQALLATALRHALDDGHHANHRPSEVLVCNTRDGHAARHITHICHLCSIIILCIFFVELLLRWWADPHHFMANSFHKLDFFVVTLSLIFDVAIVAYIESHREGADMRNQREAAELVAGLLILSRCWRVVRIFHGFFEQFHYFKEEASRPKEENEKLRLALRNAGLDPDVELAKFHSVGLKEAAT